METESHFITVLTEDLLHQVEACHKDGYRLVQLQACSVLAGEPAVPAFELIYSFEKDYRLRNLKLTVRPDEEVPSITKIFLAAFLYENEMRELFGVQIRDIAIDFKGQLYKTAVRVPFAIPSINKKTTANPEAGR